MLEMCFMASAAGECISCVVCVQSRGEVVVQKRVPMFTEGLKVVINECFEWAVCNVHNYCFSY